MQLKANEILISTAAFLCLSLGLETFYRFSGAFTLKLIGLTLLLIGLTLLGWPGGGRYSLRILAGALYIVYVVQSAWRYPGVLKEPLPFEWRAVAIFADRRAHLWLAIFVVSTIFAFVVSKSMRAQILMTTLPKCCADFRYL